MKTVENYLSVLCAKALFKQRWKSEVKVTTTGYKQLLHSTELKLILTNSKADSSSRLTN